MHMQAPELSLMHAMPWHSLPLEGHVRVKCHLRRSFVTCPCMLQIAAAYSGWQSLQAMLAINRFLGIIVLGWMPAASLAAAVVAVAAAGTYWYMTDSKSKKGLLGAQVGGQHGISFGCKPSASLLASQASQQRRYASCPM